MENRYELLISGSSQMYHISDLSFMVNYKIHIVYKWLYRVVPGVPWLALFYSFYMIITSSVFTFLIFGIFTKISYRILAILALLFVFLLPNFVFLNYTRVAFFMTASGWLLLLGYAAAKNKLTTITGLVMIFLGILTRIESGLAASILSVILCLFISGSLREVFKKSWPGLLIVITYLGFAGWQISSEQRFYFMIEPSIEHKIITGDVLPISSMQTKRDSLRYVAATLWEVEDSVNVSPDFLKSITNPKPLFIRDFSAIKSGFHHYLSSSSSVFLAFCCFAFFLLFFRKAYSRRDFIMMVLFILIGAALFLLPLLTIRILARVSEPQLFLTTFFALLLAHKRLKYPVVANKAVHIGVGLAVISLTFLSVSETCSKADTSYDNWQKGAEVLRKLDDAYPNRILYPVKDYSMFVRPAFAAGAYSTHPILLSHFAQGVYMPDARKFLSDYYPCNIYDYGCRFQYLIDNKDKIIVVMNLEAKKMYYDEWLHEYLLVFYNVDLKLKKTLDLTDEIAVYEIG